MKTLLASICALAACCFACSGGSDDNHAAGGPVSSSGEAAPARCASDEAAVGTYDFMLGSDDGWTAIVLRSDCRYCFANGDDDQASRALHAGDGVWSSSPRGDGTLGISLNHDALVLTLDPKAGTIDLTAMKLTLHPDGDGFTCDGTTVTR